jgi:hypothetical protein
MQIEVSAARDRAGEREAFWLLTSCHELSSLVRAFPQFEGFKHSKSLARI